MPISISSLTPRVYSNHSRDYQLIARLFDAVLNSVKTNVNILENVRTGDSLEDGLVNLLMLTFGIPLKHDYDTKQALTLCQVYAEAMRSKGSVQAIKRVIGALLNVGGVAGDTDNMVYVDGTELTLVIPETLSDITLLYDLLTLILPAGMTCRVIRGLRIPISDGFTTVQSTSSTYASWKDSDNTAATTLSAMQSIATLNSYKDAEFVENKAGYTIHNLVPTLEDLPAEETE